MPKTKRIFKRQGMKFSKRSGIERKTLGSRSIIDRKMKRSQI